MCCGGAQPDSPPRAVDGSRREILSPLTHFETPSRSSAFAARPAPWFGAVQLRSDIDDRCHELTSELAVSRRQRVALAVVAELALVVHAIPLVDIAAKVAARELPLFAAL